MHRLVLYTGIFFGMSFVSIGCSDQSKLLSTRLIQQAEKHAEKGKRAQDAKNYGDAITHYKGALKTIKTLKSTYPKASKTIAFNASPVLAGQKLEAIETIHLPTMRFQQMRATDMLGWTLAEVQVLKDEERRHKYYTKLFTWLIEHRDYDNANRVLQQAQQNEGDDFVESWPDVIKVARKAKIEPKKGASSMYPHRQKPEYLKLTKTERNNATFLLMALLKKNTSEGVLAFIRSHKNRFLQFHLLKHALLYLQRHEAHALLNNESKRLELIVETYNLAFMLLDRVDAILKIDRLVNKPAQKLGFKHEAEIHKVLLEHYKKQPINEQQLGIAQRLIHNLDWKVDRAFVVGEQEALAARLIEYHAKNKAFKIFRLKDFVINQIIPADFVTPKRIELAYTLATKGDANTRRALERKAQVEQIKLGLPLTVNPDLTIPVAPSMASNGSKDSALLSQRQKTLSALVALPVFVNAYKKQNNKKAMDAIVATIERSQKVHEAQRKNGEENKHLDKIIYNHKIALLNTHVYRNDHKRALTMIQEIIKTPAYKSFLSEGTNTLDHHMVKQKLTVSQRKQLSLVFLKLLKSTQTMYFIDLPFKNWFKTMVAESNTKNLKQALEQYVKSPTKVEILNTFAAFYVQQDPKYRTKTIPLFIVEALSTLKLDQLITASFENIIGMCALAEASCSSQLLNVINGMQMKEFIREMFVLTHIRLGHAKFVYDFIKLQNTSAQIQLMSIALGAELKKHGDISKILPGVRANIKEVQTKIPKNQHDKYHSDIYNIFADNGYCEALDSFITSHQDSGLTTKGAQGACSLRINNYEANLPQLLARWIASQDNRLIELLYLIKERGVLNTPMLADELKRLADTNTPVLTPRLISQPPIVR